MDTTGMDHVTLEAIECETNVNLTMRNRDLAKVFVTIVVANAATYFGMAALKELTDRKTNQDEDRSQELHAL